MHASNTFNVEASLNKWLYDTLTAMTKPAWLPAWTFVQNSPDDSELPTPAVSVHHLPISVRALYQGDNGGEGERVVAAAALLEVNVWVSRSAQNWVAQKRTLTAMVQDAFAGAATVIINDYYADAGNPASYRVVLRELETQQTGQDPNPAIDRVRMLIRYDWTLRT